MKSNIYRAKITGTDAWIYGNLHSVYGNGVDSIQSAENHNVIEYIKIDTIGILICKDKNGKDVWSNSKVLYYENECDLIYSVNGYYINNGMLSNFDESEIECID